jgi:hypothetical protein
MDMILLAMAALGPAAAADTLLSAAMEAEIDAYQPAAAAVIAELIDGPSSGQVQSEVLMSAGWSLPPRPSLAGCCCCCLCPF